MIDFSLRIVLTSHNHSYALLTYSLSLSLSLSMISQLLKFPNSLSLSLSLSLCLLCGGKSIDNDEAMNIFLCCILHVVCCIMPYFYDEYPLSLSL
ncbi:hypothetical protein OAV88_00500 [bacterium]|nr:hypothetical protein [bacterium]